MTIIKFILKVIGFFIVITDKELFFLDTFTVCPILFKTNSEENYCMRLYACFILI